MRVADGIVRVTVLGSGDAFGSGGRLHSAYLVEAPAATFLIDCGPTILQGLKRSSIDPARIDFVLVSHLHGDHFGGVPFLFMDYLYESERRRPITVYGPPGTERRIQKVFGGLYERQAAEVLPFDVRYVAVPAGRATAIGEIAVEAFAVPHVTELVCYGYRIEVAGKTILYSGDTGWTEELIARTKDVDLFICECSTFETRLDIHISYPEIHARAADLGCRRLVLSHLGSEPLEHRSQITLELAEDGMVIPL
jgi:ribonuclease BN (tRNA processing enzyme)